MSLPAGAMPGLSQLIERLRNAPLQVRVGTSEAIDAARLLAHHAGLPGADTASLEGLRLKLRPVLCKAAADQTHFNEAFDAWVAEVQAARQTGGAAAGWAADGAQATAALRADPSRADGKADAAAQRTTGPRDAAAQAAAAAAPARATPLAKPFWRRTEYWVISSVVLLAIVVLVPKRWTPPQPTQAGTAASAPALTASTPLPIAAPAPSAPQAVAPAAQPRQDTGPAIRGFTPDWHASETLRWPWLALLLGLPLLGLLPLLGAPPPLPYITRQRGAGSLTLEAWPPHKQRRQLVRDIAPATSGQLQRHVRGAVDQREAYARRPRLDVRRTVNASLARAGLLQLHYRFARLRPAYLVLVHATQDDDLGVLWARRLAELDVRAAIFRFHQAEGEAEPQCVEVGGLGRRLPFTALPAPWPEQRLLIIARSPVLVGPNGQLRDWVQTARLGRWAQRALFNPDEPRDWPRRQVQALEATHDGGLGMHVLPFEDNALDAWSDWLVRGEMPAITLEAPQLYPRLLKENEARFCGDTRPADLAPDPAQAEKLAQQIVTQLQAYLGQNGFYWLCACAVPPLLEQRLAQLLGEEYFRRCGASEPRVAAYMARNWRLLVRLPWLRAQPQQLPQWLRLALLARLPPAIQEELREVVRGALGRRAAASRPGDGLALAFDAPDALPLPGTGKVDDPRHALLVGFVQEGLDARELMLRLPGAWQQWLPAVQRRRSGQAGWSAVKRGWGRLQQADASTRGAALRWAAAGVLLGTSALVALPTVPAAQWPDALRTLLFVKQAHEVVLPAQGDAYAVDASGRRVLVIKGAELRLHDVQTGRELQRQLDPQQELLGAQFSADGSRVVTTARDSPNWQVWDAITLRALASHNRVLASNWSPRAVMPSRDGRRVLMMQARAPGAQAPAGDQLAVVDALSGQTLQRVGRADGTNLAAFAWGESVDELVVAYRVGNGFELETTWVQDPRSLLGSAISVVALPGTVDAFIALSPGGRRHLTQTGGLTRLGPPQPGEPAMGEPLFDQPVHRAAFSASGRHLVVQRGDPPTDQLLRATDQSGPVTKLPTDLPAGTAFVPANAAYDGGAWRFQALPLAGGVMALALLLALGMSARAARRAAQGWQVAR